MANGDYHDYLSNEAKLHVTCGKAAVFLAGKAQKRIFRSKFQQWMQKLVTKNLLIVR